MKFDLKTIATIVTMIGLLATGIGKLFVMDYRIGTVEQQVIEINANVQLLLGHAITSYNLTVPPGGWTLPTKEE